MSRFICPVCGQTTDGFPCGRCGTQIRDSRGILHFANEETDAWHKPEESYLAYNQGACERYPFAETDYYPECSKKLIDLFGIDARYADIGVGFGKVPLQLAGESARVIAVDISEGILNVLMKQAKEQNMADRIDAACMNAYSLYIPDQSVDVVIVNNLFMMLGTPWKVVREVNRILKPNGVLVMYGREYLNSERNDAFLKMKEDVQRYFAERLKDAGYPKVWNDIDMKPLLEMYFEQETDVFCEEKMLERSFSKILERMKYNGWNRYQHVPQDVYERAWRETDRYAKEKYGVDYQGNAVMEHRRSKLFLYQKKQV